MITKLVSTLQSGFGQVQLVLLHITICVCRARRSKNPYYNKPACIAETHDFDWKRAGKKSETQC